MSNQKWDITEAAIKRIKARITELSASGSEDWYFHPWDLLLEAMEPENYARERKVAEELVTRWIREGEMRWLTAQCFGSYAAERKELREAGRGIMRGIESFKEMDL